MIGGFPSQRANIAESVCMSYHHVDGLVQERRNSLLTHRSYVFLALSHLCAHLNIWDGRPQRAGPVHETCTTIDDPIVMHADESFLHSATHFLEEMESLNINTVKNLLLIREIISENKKNVKKIFWWNKDNLRSTQGIQDSFFTIMKNFLSQGGNSDRKILHELIMALWCLMVTGI